ncbi:MAG: dioxygenase extradiol, partial [Thermoanaerobaculia bacterium]|nr:dioxygenase extradiol [Thermoanaerobaculia bacterium]
YDFGGFSPELYKIVYAAPGDPDLAAEVAQLTGAQLEQARGWDHGLWVPLKNLRPQANIPIVELSLPVGATPAELMSIGKKLAPLRDRNVMIAGSGGIVHNLGRINLAAKFADVDPWAREFDEFIADTLERRDFDAITNYQTRGPNASLAVPTPEHFEPLLVLLGAASDRDRTHVIHEGITYGNLSMRTFALRE